MRLLIQSAHSTQEYCESQRSVLDSLSLSLALSHTAKEHLALQAQGSQRETDCLVKKLVEIEAELSEAHARTRKLEEGWLVQKYED